MRITLPLPEPLLNWSAGSHFSMGSWPAVLYTPPNFG